MLSSIKLTQEFPFIGRSASRSVVSSINFVLLVEAQRVVRERLDSMNKKPDLNGYKMPEGTGIENAEDVIREEGYTAEDDLRAAEQGNTVDMTAGEIAAQLRLIRDAIAADMCLNAKDMRYDLPETLEMNLNRQINQEARPLTAEKRVEAKALGMSEEDLMESVKRSQKNKAKWLTDNKVDILQTAEALIFDNPENLSVETIWDKLPNVTKLRLYFAADNGLWFGREQELRSYLVYNRQEGKANAWLIDKERISFHKEIEAFQKQPKVARELRDAYHQGISLPNFRPLIIPEKAAA